MLILTSSLNMPGNVMVVLVDPFPSIVKFAFVLLQEISSESESSSSRRLVCSRVCRCESKCFISLMLLGQTENEFPMLTQC